MSTGIRIPPQIPLPDKVGYGDTYEESRTTSVMESGPPRIRNKFRTAPKLIDVQFSLSQYEYQIFEVWWQEAIRGGELEFDIQLIDDTETVVWYTCRWLGGSFTAEIAVDNDWVVAGKLRTIGGPFDIRPADTDELEGLSRLLTIANGSLLIGKTLRGKSVLSIAAKGKLYSPIFGKATLQIVTKGRLAPYELHGLVQLSIVAEGELD